MSATLNFREQRLTELQEELTKKLRDTDIERNEFHVSFVLTLAMLLLCHLFVKFNFFRKRNSFV